MLVIKIVGGRKGGGGGGVSIPRDLVHEIINRRRRGSATSVAVCHRLLDQSRRIRISNNTVALPFSRTIIPSLWITRDKALSLGWIRGEVVEHGRKPASFVGILKSGEDVLRDFEEMAVLVEELGGDEIGHCGNVCKGAVADADGFQIYGKGVFIGEDGVGEVGDLGLVSRYIYFELSYARSYLRR